MGETVLVEEPSGEQYYKKPEDVQPGDVILHGHQKSKEEAIEIVRKVQPVGEAGVVLDYTKTKDGEPLQKITISRPIPDPASETKLVQEVKRTEAGYVYVEKRTPKTPTPPHEIQIIQPEEAVKVKTEEEKEWGKFQAETKITQEEYKQVQTSVFTPLEERTVQARLTTKSEAASWVRERFVSVGVGFGKSAEVMTKPAFWKTTGTMVTNPTWFGMSLVGVGETTKKEIEEHPLEFVAETGVSLVVTGGISKGFGKIKTKFVKPKISAYVEVGKVTQQGKIGYAETTYILEQPSRVIKQVPVHDLSLAIGKPKLTTKTYVGKTQTIFTIPDDPFTQLSTGISGIEVVGKTGKPVQMVSVSGVKQYAHIKGLDYYHGFAKTTKVSPVSLQKVPLVTKKPIIMKPTTTLKPSGDPIGSFGVFVSQKGTVTKTVGFVVPEKGMREAGISLMGTPKPKPSAVPPPLKAVQPSGKLSTQTLGTLAKAHAETSIKQTPVSSPVKMLPTLRPTSFMTTKPQQVQEEFEILAFPKTTGKPTISETLLIPKTIAETRIEPAQALKQRQITRPSQKRIRISTTTPVQKQIPASIQLEKPIAVQISEPVQLTRQQPIQRTSTPLVPVRMITAITPPPPVIPIPFSLPKLKGFSGEGRKPKAGLEREFKYTPSLVAFDFGIKGKKPKAKKMFSGLEIRPVIKGGKKKNERFVW